MKFKIKNKYLKESIQLLNDAPLSGMQSIARTRLIKVLEKPLKDYSEATNELVESVVERDSDGKPVNSGQGLKIQQGKEKEYYDTTKELDEQFAEIDEATYSGHESDVKSILQNYSAPMSGNRADAYMALCEALNVFDIKEE
ncbi:hypothetical protein HOU90_gp002 [Lactobacillus phage Lpa804]|uniref:Uncharacterized protein n=1 Tax=Lactobacillus phage Lpa804 TaxID=2059850 RepID=A0A3S6QA59_9CAUD|nr:hypothetical protein HOU90_gp002 [Lactobacillus phage Lpa804]AUG84632.1 hypothetical protein Lpa804_2 [Lactobacillus phage Lpa804]